MEISFNISREEEEESGPIVLETAEFKHLLLSFQNYASIL